MGLTQNGSKSGAKLTKNKVWDKESIRVPTHPFAYQSFMAFVAGLLACPGVEDTLDQAWEQKGTEWEGTKDMWDIWDGLAIHKLEGVDNKPFSNGLVGSTQLIWNLSIDWFNPFMNKESGKTASTRSIKMVCLNLPPSMCHKPENLWLSIIPGPQEPDTDQTNHFLHPLIKDLWKSWTAGT